jgi:hypothetical protein
VNVVRGWLIAQEMLMVVLYSGLLRDAWRSLRCATPRGGLRLVWKVNVATALGVILVMITLTLRHINAWGNPETPIVAIGHLFTQLALIAFFARRYYYRQVDFSAPESERVG